MRFCPIASGSSGNAYYIKSNEGSALIELGIPWKKIMEAVNFKTSELDFAVYTHSHSDHSKSAKYALKAGVEVYCSQPSADAVGISGHHRVNILTAGQQVKIKGWTILPFDLAHDVPTLGFLISDGQEKLLFIPDTGFIENRFSDVNILAIEANHAEDILAANVANGTLDASLARRTRRNHMSIEVLKGFILANKFESLREVHLIHMSNANSIEARFIREIQEITGVPVYAA